MYTTGQVLIKYEILIILYIFKEDVEAGAAPVADLSTRNPPLQKRKKPSLRDANHDSLIRDDFISSVDLETIPKTLSIILNK